MKCSNHTVESTDKNWIQVKELKQKFNNTYLTDI